MSSRADASIPMLAHAIEEMLVPQFSDVRRESVAVRRNLLAGDGRWAGEW